MEFPEQATENNNNNEGLFVVERIINKRRRGNKTEYLIKWEGWSWKNNSWEPQENLVGCSSLLEEFESQKAKRARTRKHLDESSSSSAKSQKNLTTHQEKDDVERTKLKKRRKTERIIGATVQEGALKFLIKWKNVDEPELVSNTLVRERMPDKLIQFYERHLKWLD